MALAEKPATMTPSNQHTLPPSPIALPPLDASKKPLTPSILPQIALGNPKAPVYVEMIFCLTCRHCGEFYTTTFQKIKPLIDSGKIYWIFKQYPMDPLALAAASLTYCEDDKKTSETQTQQENDQTRQDRYTRMDYLLTHQEAWITRVQKGPPDRLHQRFEEIAKNLGLTLAQCQACLKNQRLIDTIVFQRFDLQDDLKLTALPAYVIAIPALKIRNLHQGVLDFSVVEAYVKKIETHPTRMTK